MKTIKCVFALFLILVLGMGSCTSTANMPTPQTTTTLTPKPTATATPVPTPTATLPPQKQGVIAFYLKQGNMGGGIYLISADGSGEPIMLSAHPSNDSKPSWSPDGSKIVFESLRDDVANQQHLDIYMMNSDSSQLERITDTDGWYAQPDWSPDGNRLAIASDKEEKGNTDLYILDLDTRELTRVTDDPATDRNPSWSPDASHLVFFSNRSGNWDVYTVDVETGETAQLTNHPGDDFHPDWSPDGQKILFSSSRDGDSEIYIMDVDGENQKRLTNTPGNDTDPEWSPDGIYFAYTHDTSGVGEIYVMDLIDSPPKLLFENTNKAALGLPVWSITADIDDKPVFGPPFCLRDTNGDMKPDTMTNAFSTAEFMPFVTFPYRNMNPNLTTSIQWDYDKSDELDFLSMALAWKHGESGWYTTMAGGMTLSSIGPGKLTIRLLIGDTLMQEIVCEIKEPTTQPTKDPIESAKIETATPGTNLAYKKQVRVSHALSSNPAQMAVDRNLENWWGSGAFAPQWIEIDLGANYVIGEVKLLPNQSPAGKTVHRLLVKGPVTNDQYELLYTFEGLTVDFMWLSHKLDEPMRGIRYIRVETVSSPSWVSWREIEAISGE